MYSTYSFLGSRKRKGKLPRTIYLCGWLPSHSDELWCSITQPLVVPSTVPPTDPDIIRIQQASIKPNNFIGRELIVRSRRRPKATSTTVRSVRAEFGNAVRKNLAIPY